MNEKNLISFHRLGNEKKCLFFKFEQGGKFVRRGAFGQFASHRDTNCASESVNTICEYVIEILIYYSERPNGN